MNGEKNVLEFKFERMIAATPAEAFDAWLDPKVPGNPWNTADMLLLDPKVNGFFYWKLRGTPHYGRFINVQRGARLEHTWVSPNTLGEETNITITFEKKGDQTLMTLVHAGIPDCDRGKGHLKGWNYFLDLLVHHLAGDPSASPPEMPNKCASS